MVKKNGGVKNLKARLDTEVYDNSWTEKGRISSKRPKTLEKLESLITVVEKFLGGKKSSLKWIKKIKKKVIDSIREMLEDNDFEPTEDEVESFYEMFADSDYNYFSERIGASEFRMELQSAREEKASYNQFLERISSYFDGDSIDDDFKDRVERVYTEYVVPYFK